MTHKSAIVLLCIAAIARADGNTPPAKSRAGFVDFSDPRGAIIPATLASRFRCELGASYAALNHGFFTPTIDDVRRFERRLASSPPDLSSYGEPDLLLHKHLRHYFGVTIGKFRRIHVYLYLLDPEDRADPHRAFCVDDGGCGIVYVDYDAVSDKIISVDCNGEA